jgi:hypothetical protein
LRIKKESLVGLYLFHESGRGEIFRWKVDDILRYLSNHKSYFKTIYKRRSREMYLVPIQNAMDENERMQVALLESPLEGGVVMPRIEQHTRRNLKEEDVDSFTKRKKAN